MSFQVLASLVVAAIGLYVVLGRSKATGYAPLPPGPKGWPVIGNLLDEPTDGKPWETYREWGREHNSDVLYMNILGQPIIILNSWDAVNDLIEKRSNLYSSRPLRTMVYELMGWGKMFPFMPYGDRWRAQRKMFTREFTPTAVLRYHPQQITTTNTLLNRLVESPDEWHEHLKLQAGQVIMSIAYGFEVKTGKDMFYDVISLALAGLQIAALPGAYLVDVMPILKYVPSWFPGTGWQRQAAKWGHATEQMIELPYKKALDRIAAGTAMPSYISYAHEALDPNEDNADNELMIKQTAASMYSAGSDTVIALVLCFVLAMIKYPEVQKKAQAELDAVIGANMLPEFAHEDSLPYCGALVKELYRWRPASNLAIPRETDQEDVYKGFRIPAGSVILPNGWAILHNEEVYPDPMEFKPERFIKDGKLNLEMGDPTEVGAFGYGRRVCPGQFMGMNSVWLTVVSILASMNITRAVDAHGNEIEPSGKQHGAIVHALLPFKCSFKPRSTEVVNVIRARA
ncbi:cytochrome P450 [Athelia psychrophila]|uniref:Cytochrome P450 n=1 Tax=Athelia psychrophila TaxID=1759441 RepID=A0A167WIA4_9AGAM|nr:cytochrome P450 [Fibularhizoctonia sp. CBS 109695]